MVEEFEAVADLNLEFVETLISENVADGFGGGV